MIEWDGEEVIWSDVTWERVSVERRKTKIKVITMAKSQET